jgi:hypothetical protein
MPPQMIPEKKPELVKVEHFEKFFAYFSRKCIGIHFLLEHIRCVTLVVPRNESIRVIHTRAMDWIPTDHAKRISLRAHKFQNLHSLISVIRISVGVMVRICELIQQNRKSHLARSGGGLCI